ncbi:hypothetical protein TWF281_001194 [Arthrobotrys megalospora]
MKPQRLQLSFISLLLSLTHNPHLIDARVPILERGHSGLMARDTGGSSSPPEWFTKKLKKIDAPEPKIKASKEFIQLSKDGAQFANILGRAKDEEIPISVDAPDDLTRENNYLWGGDVVKQRETGVLSRHRLSGDDQVRYNALASMFRGATNGGDLINDFSQVTLFNIWGSAEPPYKFLMSRGNKMMIIERSRPSDDMAGKVVDFADIAYQAWNEYCKNEKVDIASGVLEWVALIDLDETTQKFVKEAYDVMKGAISNLQLSKPGYDRLVLSRETEEEEVPEEGPEEEGPGEDPPEKPTPTSKARGSKTPKPTPPDQASDEPEPTPQDQASKEPKPTQTPKEPEPTPDVQTPDKPEPTPPPKPPSGPLDSEGDPDGGQTPAKMKRQAGSSDEKQIEIDVFNALLATPSAREIIYMLVQNRERLDHRSVDLMLTQPNRWSGDNSAFEMHMLLRISKE